MIRIMLSTSLLVVIWTIPIMNGFSFAPVSLHENRNSPDRCSRLLKSIDFRFQHPQQQQKVVSYTLLQAASHRRNLDNDQFEYEEDYEDDYEDDYEYESNYNQRRKQKNYDYNNNYKDDEYDYDEDYEYYDEDMEDNNYYEKYDYEELDLNDESQSLYEWESYGSTDILLPTISSSSSSDNNSDNNKLPTAIVHFIGGTFVGSLPPRIAYRSFLEGLSQHYGNIVIIATSIPLTDSTPLSSNDGILPKVISPLNHWKQIQTIRRNLYQTIQYVLYDEYQDRNLVDQIPIVGIGHSLGGRLQVLLHSHPKQEIQKIQQDIYDKYDDEYRSRSRSRSKRRRQANAKKKRRENIGNVLISFNNFNAPRSIPLLDEANLLWKTSRGLSQRLIQILRGDYDDDDDDDDDDDEFFNSRKQRRKRSQDYDSMKDDMDDDLYRRPRRRRQSQSQNDNDKDDDKDIFEFDPSPEKLWNIIRQSSFVPQSVKPDKVKAKNDKYENEDDDYYDDDDDDYYERNKRSRRQRSQPQPSSFSYTVPRNLIIQFDNDELDQSAEFARRFMEANASTNTSDNNDENNNHHKNNNSTSDATVAFSSVPNEPDPSSSPPPKQQQQSQSKPQQMLDLKFARLRGNHLTPCTSPGDGNLFLDNENANERNDDDDDDKKNDDSNETAKSRMKKQRMSRKQERRNQELQDLITSVSSYIQFLVHDNAVTASVTATDNNKKGEKEKEKETVEETIAQSSSSSSSLSSSTNREKKNNEEGFYKQ